MKNNILTFIIGILLGSLIATMGWCLYIKNITLNPDKNQMMNKNLMKERPEMPQNMQQNGGAIPQDMPINQQ